jgi:hypothetical protein
MDGTGACDYTPCVLLFVMLGMQHGQCLHLALQLLLLLLHSALNSLHGCVPAGTDFMQCAVEAVPPPDGSLNAVICMCAFDELPEEACCTLH